MNKYTKYVLSQWSYVNVVEDCDGKFSIDLRNSYANPEIHTNYGITLSIADFLNIIDRLNGEEVKKENCLNGIERFGWEKMTICLKPYKHEFPRFHSSFMPSLTIKAVYSTENYSRSTERIFLLSSFEITKLCSIYNDIIALINFKELCNDFKKL